MEEKIYEQKWDKEKIDSIVKILGDRILQRRGVRGEVIEAFAETEEVRYVITIRESLYDFLWAEITRKGDGAEEFYATYEEVIEAVKNMARGKRPFNFVSCYMRRDICCYCRYWSGDRGIDSDRKLWVDPDVKAECTFQIAAEGKKECLPDSVACKKYELLDLEEAWKEAGKR